VQVEGVGVGVKVDDGQVHDLATGEEVSSRLLAVDVDVVRVVGHREHGHERRNLGCDVSDVVKHGGAVNTVVVGVEPDVELEAGGRVELLDDLDGNYI
jgi:hypothetical protein